MKNVSQESKGLVGHHKPFLGVKIKYIFNRKHGGYTKFDYPTLSQASRKLFDH